MSLADYAHWNEDARYVWWMEEGRHVEEPPEPDDDFDAFYDRDVYDCETCEDGDDLAEGETCEACGLVATYTGRYRR